MPNNKKEDVDFYKLFGDNHALQNPPQEETDTSEEDAEKKSISFLFRFGAYGVGVLGIMLILLVVGYVILPNLSNQQKIQVNQAQVPDTNVGTEDKAKNSVVDEILEVKALVKNYLGAKTIEKKARFCRHPERILPLMKRWYQERELTAIQMNPETTFTAVQVYERFFWKVEMPSERKYKKQLWVQKYSDGTLAVDWETDVVYNPMKWDDFLKNKPTNPLTFRVYVGWDNFYTGSYRDETIYQAFTLENRDSDQIITSYIKRGSPACNAMLQLIKSRAKNHQDLKNSVSLPFLVTLRYEQDESGGKNIVIDTLNSPSWIIFKKMQ